MVIAVESLLFLLVGIVLAVVLIQVFGRGKAGEGQTQLGATSVKLVRTARTTDGREETLLMINERVILTADNDGVRLADYADDVEQLEAVAARLGAALGVNVEFARVGVNKPGEENGVSMRELPRTTDEEIEQIEVRHRPGNTGRSQGAG